MDRERLWVVLASLMIVGSVFIFFVGAPAILNFPLDYDQAIRIMQIILPVFVGYLGMATSFIFDTPAVNRELPQPRRKLLRVLLRGPVYFLAIGLMIVLGIFWYTNRKDGPPASGMTIEQLSWFITSLLGLLSATTGLIVSKIFPTGQPEDSGNA